MVRLGKRLAAVVAVGLVLTGLVRHAAAVVRTVEKTAAFSAVFLLSDGWPFWSQTTVAEMTRESPGDAASRPAPASESPSASAVSPLPPTPPEGVEVGKIRTVTFSPSSANLTAQGVHVSNKTGLNIDVASYLQQGLPFSMADTSQPQVLIVHTHATEAYTPGDYGYYIKSDETRSTDTAQSVVQVGEVMAQVLNEAGIVTINDHTLHDHPNYTGSYTRSAQTIRDYLEKYPSIKVVIDGHRDAIGTQEEKLKPTAVINGVNAAQIMILAGCETGDVEGYPNWEENLRFCLQLQKQIETDAPGLARPLCLKACKYNFDLLNGSILIEIGTDANTLEEAMEAGRLTALALTKVLQPA